MTDETVNERIIREKATAATRLANMKQAHERIHEYRKGVERLRYLDLPEGIARELSHLAQTIEDVEWHVETAVRESV